MIILAVGNDQPPAPAVLTDGQAIVFTLLGSAAVLLLSGIKYAKLPRPQRPDLKDPIIWLTPLLFNPLRALIAALMCVYGKQPLTSFAAVALGAGAPVFVQRVIDTFAPVPPPPRKPPGA